MTDIDMNNFDAVLAAMYKDTFPVEYNGMTFTFKQKLPAEVSYKARTLNQDGKNAEKVMWYTVANLSVSPKLTVEQVSKLPEDFYTLVYLKYTDFLAPEIKEKSAEAQQQLIVASKTSSLS